jgi:predicted RND superfamily exporter protein
MGILGVTYFSVLHALLIFIVLGIAADDVFVLIDAWKQSAAIDVYEGDFKKRMSYSWRRAVKAIAVTSLTTTAAFLANLVSPMMPYISLGLYAAIVVLANYFLIVMLFPPAIIIYEKYFAKYKCCCCCPRESNRNQ